MRCMMKCLAIVVFLVIGMTPLAAEEQCAKWFVIEHTPLAPCDTTGACCPECESAGSCEEGCPKQRVQTKVSWDSSAGKFTITAQYKFTGCTPGVYRYEALCVVRNAQGEQIDGFGISNVDMPEQPLVTIYWTDLTGCSDKMADILFHGGEGSVELLVHLAHKDCGECKPEHVVSCWALTRADIVNAPPLAPEGKTPSEPSYQEPSVTYPKTRPAVFLRWETGSIVLVKKDD